MLVGKLPSGPLDIVGDVHGELDALKILLEVMGYSVDGVHPELPRSERGEGSGILSLRI